MCTPKTCSATADVSHLTFITAGLCLCIIMNPVVTSANIRTWYVVHNTNSYNRQCRLFDSCNVENVALIIDNKTWLITSGNLLKNRFS